MAIKVLAISGYTNPLSSRPEAEMFIRLHQAGLQVSIMTQGDSYYARRFRQEGLRVIDFHPAAKFSLEAIGRIRREIVEQGINVLHLFNSRAIINGLFAALGTPVKVVLYRGYTGNVHWYNPANYLKFLHPRVDAIHCIADATRDHIRANMLVGKEKVVSIRKGHDPAWYAGVQPADLSSFGISPNDFVMVCVANARPMKAIPDLIKATYGFPAGASAHLILVGKGMDQPHIQRLIAQSPIREHIHLAGFRQDALEIVKASDVFVLASVKGEAITKAVIEAMSLGTTPVITDIPGNRGLVIAGESGLVVPPGAPHKLGDALLRLWNDRQLCKQLGEGARKHIQTHFHIDQSVREVQALYERLCAGS